ncbi:hypothetical protein DNTS_015250 [Danionella cerebrum]|uniref:Uncharacterized protein n=1 Tax=Danionella cerebrum TaxID=2873325 RepID=A0A553MSF9_9TELE|nr:hypothetical protein DNTS_015250 [Danionella translucida]
MEMASEPGAVSMEMPVRATLAALVEDEEHDAPGPGTAELRHRVNFYMLIVIGEIASEHQLQSAREHIERGEPLLPETCSSISLFFSHLHHLISSHFNDGFPEEQVLRSA